MEPHPKFCFVIEADANIKVLREYLLHTSAVQGDRGDFQGVLKWFERTGNGDWLGVLM